MSYPVTLEGFEDQEIVAHIGFWTGPRLLVNGQPAPKGKSRAEMLLRRRDGRQVVVMWKQNLFGLDVPQLIVDGRVVNLVQPLKWYQMLWSALPIALMLIGGALGALAGFTAFYFSARVFRSNLSPLLKYVASGLVSLLGLALYILLATIFLNLFRR